MPRVICDLPNASDEISGVKFHPLEEGGRISDEISEEMAKRFASIPGYEMAPADLEPEIPPEPKPAPKSRKSKSVEKAAEKEAQAPVEEVKPSDEDAASGDGGEAVF